MLTLNEVKLLKIINDNADKQNVALISLASLLVFLNNKKLNESDIKKSLIILMQSDYLEVTFINKNSQEYCLITLKNKGKNYKIEKVSVRRQLVSRIIFAFTGAIVSFIVGKILYLIFS